MMKSPYFTEDHHFFRQTVRTFMEKEVNPHIDAWEDERKIPRSIWKKMGDMGYLGLEQEAAYGGSEADFFYTLVFLEELARVKSGGFTSAVSVHSYMATNHLAMTGNPELKEKYLRPAIAGEMIAALAISEPAAGSNVAGIQTHARRAGDFFIVNGAKNFITNGTYADFLVCAVKTEKGISLLLIEGDRPGVSRTKLDKMGWHASDTAEIGFSDVQVPVSNLVGEEGKGFKYIMDSFQLERLVAAILGVGGAMGILDMTLQYMSEREAFGRPINKFQVLRHQIADLATEIESCKQFVHHTAWLHQQGEYVVKQCSMVKLLASELANKVVDRCLQMFGGYGYMEEFPIARAYRDARVGTIAGGTSEIMKEIIAKMVIDDVQYQAAYVEVTADSPPMHADTPSAADIVRSLDMRFKADKAKGYAAVIHYDISGGRGGQFTVSIQDQSCTVQEGLSGDTDCLITVADQVYEQLELGKLNPQTAFMLGDIQVSDLPEMMKFMKYFKRYKQIAVSNSQ